MTATESEGAEPRACTATRRRALIAAGMERPVAEVLADVLDEVETPLLTGKEADTRFEAMLREHRAERARNRAETRAEFAELRGELRAETGALRGETGELRGEVATAVAELRGDMAAATAELRTDMEKLRVDMTWRMFLVVGSMLAVATALERLLG